MNSSPAYLFDLNGTMVDDMQYHITAWHHILNDLDANLTWEQMKNECYGKNDELLERIFPGRFDEETKNKLGAKKEADYRKEFQSQLKLIPGLGEFLSQAHAGNILMAIGSAAITPNIDFVLDGLGIRHLFKAIISADDVTQSKPSPETFLKCAAGLNHPPSQCIVFEDAPKGVVSAARAGMFCVVLTITHQPEEFAALDNVICFMRDYTDLTPAKLHMLWQQHRK